MAASIILITAGAIFCLFGYALDRLWAAFTGLVIGLGAGLALGQFLGAEIWPVVAGTALGVALAMGLFVVLPAFVAGLLAKVIHSQLILTVVEGVTKIGLLIAYLGLVAQMDEIHRMYQYHGAEHKTIACYEAGEELTPANVKKHTRFHPRCGTSFLLIVLVISILVFSILPRGGSLWITVGLKLLLMPLVVGIAYEIIKLAGRYDNWLTRLISKPGLWLQRLTTKEPDESMMEVAIAAMKPCIPKEEGLDNW